MVRQWLSVRPRQDNPLRRADRVQTAQADPLPSVQRPAVHQACRVRQPHAR